jgi:hypothetical protein
MHLEGPWLSMGGKKKGKPKFRNAEAKRQHEKLEQEWLELKKRHGAVQEEKKRLRALGADTLSYSLQAPPGRETKHIPSRGDGLGTAAMAEPKVYTGDKILGIGQLHKSNAVPVFRSEDAEDIARMRR